MMEQQIFKQSVGLDISKDTFVACFSQRQAGKSFHILSSRTFKCTNGAFEQFHKWVQSQRHASAPLQLLMEATGVYYEELAYFLHAKGYPLTVLLPNKTAAFAKSLSYKSKTDSIDAKMLAQMSIERDLPRWVPFSDSVLAIKRLCRERAEVIDTQVVFKNRLHAKQHAYRPLKSSLQRTKKAQALLKKQVSDIEIALLKAVKEDEFLRQKVENACSVPGVGFVTVANILAETNAFALFKSKAQLVSYAGYDVVQNTSGTSLNSPTKISKKGNHRIRKAMYFPALVAVKSDPNMKNLFNRAFDKTKIKMKAYVAVQRKLLVLIYATFKSNQPYDPNHISIKAN
ncbi:MAG: IS110 family transposase [Saprospiraceae bacterium]